MDDYSTCSTDFPTLFQFSEFWKKLGLATIILLDSLPPSPPTMASTTADMPATETTMTTGHSDSPPDFAFTDAPVPIRPTKKAKPKYITRKQANALLIDSGETISVARRALEPARELAERAGLSVESSILGKETSAVDSDLTPQVLMTTGGHSNTDHFVVRTGDPRTDRIAELKRNFQRRSRSMKPEDRAENR